MTRTDRLDKVGAYVAGQRHRLNIVNTRNTGRNCDCTMFRRVIRAPLEALRDAGDNLLTLLCRRNSIRVGHREHPGLKVSLDRVGAAAINLDRLTGDSGELAPGESGEFSGVQTFDPNFRRVPERPPENCGRVCKVSRLRPGSHVQRPVQCEAIIEV